MQLGQDIDAVVERMVRFSTSGRTGDALVMVDGNSSSHDHRSKGLNEWQFPSDMEAFLDQSIQALEVKWEGRDDIKDDSIPALFPRYGIAELSAFAGSNVQVDFSTNKGQTHRIRKAGQPEECQKDIYRNLGIEWCGLPCTRSVVSGHLALAEDHAGRAAL